MDDELERIRERKRRELRERAEGDQQRATSPSEPIAIESPAHFERTLETYPTVLVDFYADWCGPCQMLAPTLERLAADTEAAIAKVDTDAQPQLAQRHGVRGLPTLVLFRDGEVAERLVGMQQEDRLRQVLERTATD